MLLSEKLKNLDKLVLENKEEEILEMFSGVDIVTSTTGRITNTKVFRYYFAKLQELLKEIKASFSLINQFKATGVIITEFRMSHLSLVDHQEKSTGAAIICDVDNQKIKAMRIYMSTKNIIGKRTCLPALLEPDEDVYVPAISRKYFKCLGAQDLEGWLSCFSEEGTFQGSAGNVRQGKDTLTKFFVDMKKDMNIPDQEDDLKHCRVYCDDHCVATEWIIGDLRKDGTIPQSGFAIYGFTDHDGKIIYARTYDDPINNATAE